MNIWLRVLLVMSLCAAAVRCGDAPTQPLTATPVPTQIPTPPPTSPPTPAPTRTTPTRTPVPFIPTATQIPGLSVTLTPLPTRTAFDLNGVWGAILEEPGHNPRRLQARILRTGNSVEIRLESSWGESYWGFEGYIRGGDLLWGNLYCCLPLDKQGVASLHGTFYRYRGRIELSGDGYVLTLTR